MAAGDTKGEKETDQVQDTELTLSTGKLLGIFFALVSSLWRFFTMGYLLGKSTSQAAERRLSPPSQRQRGGQTIRRK